MNARRVGDLDGHAVWLCSGISPGTAWIEPTPKPHFTCGFFLFDSKWTPDEMRPLIAFLIESGCVSMMFHGGRCQEAEDLADDVFVEGAYEANFGGEDDTLMTTSADGETVVSAVFDLFRASFPTNGFKSSSFYVFAFGSNDESDDLARLLADPHQTIQEALSTMPRVDSAAEITTENLHRELALAVPESEPLIAYQQRDFGCVYSHLLFGDLMGFMLDAWRNAKKPISSDQAAVSVFVRIFDFIERCLESSDEEISSLPTLSFLGMLAPDDEYTPDLLQFARPKTLRAYAQLYRRA